MLQLCKWQLSSNIMVGKGEENLLFTFDHIILLMVFCLSESESDRVQLFFTPRFT